MTCLLETLVLQLYSDQCTVDPPVACRACAFTFSKLVIIRVVRNSVTSFSSAQYVQGGTSLSACMSAARLSPVLITRSIAEPSRRLGLS